MNTGRFRPFRATRTPDNASVPHYLPNIAVSHAKLLGNGTRRIPAPVGGDHLFAPVGPVPERQEARVGHHPACNTFAPENSIRLRSISPLMPGLSPPSP